MKVRFLKHLNKICFSSIFIYSWNRIWIKSQTCIEKEDTSVLDESVNSMIVKLDGYNFKFKCPVNNGIMERSIGHYSITKWKTLNIYRLMISKKYTVKS
jgi:hypothetical protein